MVKKHAQTHTHTHTGCPKNKHTLQTPKHIKAHTHTPRTHTNAYNLDNSVDNDEVVWFDVHVDDVEVVELGDPTHRVEPVLPLASTSGVKLNKMS